MRVRLLPLLIFSLQYSWIQTDSISAHNRKLNGETDSSSEKRSNVYINTKSPYRVSSPHTPAHKLWETVLQTMEQTEIQNFLANILEFFTHINLLTHDIVRSRGSPSTSNRKTQQTHAQLPTLQPNAILNDSSNVHGSQKSAQKIHKHLPVNTTTIHAGTNENNQLQDSPELSSMQRISSRDNESGVITAKLQNFSDAQTQTPRRLLDKHSQPLRELFSDNDLELEDSFFKTPNTFFEIVSQKHGESLKGGSSSCLTDLMRIFTELKDKELWTLTFLDAWAKPGPGILELELNWAGNYDECREAKAPPTENGGNEDGFGGKYCVVGVEPAFDIPGMHAVVDNFKMQTGLCVPDTCNVQELDFLMSFGLSYLNLTKLLNAKPSDCHVEHRSVTTATVIAIVILSVLGTLVIAGTITEVVLLIWSEWGDEITERLRRPSRLFSEVIYSRSHRGSVYSEYQPIIGNMDDTKPDKNRITSQPVNPKWYSRTPAQLRKFVMAFSAYSNTIRFLNTSQSPGSLPAVTGIRFFTSIWVLAAQYWRLTPQFAANAFKASTGWFERRSFDLMMNADLAVDTFLAISGLFTAYFTLMHLKRTGWRINWPGFYLMRFWRLTPPYMILLVSILGLQRFLGSGALWASVQPHDKEYCEDRWWANLLYISNLVEPGKICMDATWYLCIEMQVFLITPPLLIMLYLNTAVGMLACSLCMLTSWTITGVLSSENHWGMQRFEIGIEHSDSDLDWEKHYLKAPWCRLGPAMVGLMAGTYLAKHGGKVWMKWYTCLVGWALSLGVGLTIIYGVHEDMDGEGRSSNDITALYNAVSRSVWGACISWIVLACASGYGGWVDRFLSWKTFIPLSRLSFIVYMINESVFYVLLGNMERPMYLSDLTLIFSFIGSAIIIYFVAFVGHIVVDAPLLGLERAFSERGGEYL